MLERTDVTTNEVLEPITFVLAYPTVFSVYLRWLAEQAFERIFRKVPLLQLVMSRSNNHLIKHKTMGKVQMKCITSRNYKPPSQPYRCELSKESGSSV